MVTFHFRNSTKYFYILYIITFLTISSCQSNTSQDKIKHVLLKAEDNRIELEKVIRYYSQNEEDSLKLKAAHFLISNMPGHYSYTSKTLVKFDKIFEIIASKERYKPLIGNYHFPVTNKSWDSLVNLYGNLNRESLFKVEDYEIISANLLIENIEYAFKAWELPWSKHLEFEEFCEYILPYRFYDEYLESWRPAFWKKYYWLKDSMKGSTDPVRACSLINNDLKKWFRFNEVFNFYPTAISPNNLLKAKMGRCLDQAGIANFAMRTMGIPVTHEFIPQWADRSMGHDFSSVLSKNGKFIDFLGGELAPGKNEIRNVPPKIFRVMFSKQHSIYQNTYNISSYVPKLFKNNFIKDVTKEYIPVQDINLNLTFPGVEKIKFIYLCVFNNESWAPIDIAEIHSGKATFKNVGRNSIYLPVYFKDNNGIPADYPILLNKDGTLQTIKIKNTTQTVKLNRKYPLNGIKIWWLTLMGRGQFQGANKSDFSDVHTLFSIPDTIPMQMNRSPIRNRNKYRFVRYKFPNNTSGSLGEIAFYEDIKSWNPLTGRKLRAKGVDSLDLEIAFDQKLDKFIDRTPNSEYNGLWIGLDLGNKKEIRGVGYSPRNDRNNIMKGMDYELLYWNNEWISLGHKFSFNEDDLIFDHAPLGALFWLRNHTEGKEERIFLYQDRNQVWW